MRLYGRAAVSLVDHLLAGRFMEATLRFDRGLAKNTSLALLERTWTDLIERFGEPIARGDPLPTRASLRRLCITVRCQRGEFDVLVDCAPYLGRIYGVDFWPPSEALKS